MAQFLLLPFEIRALVYMYLFRGKCFRSNELSPLSLACRQIFYETPPFARRMATISFVSWNEQSTLKNPMKQLAGIQKIKIHLSDVFKLGYEQRTGKWQRLPELESVKHITVYAEMMLCRNCCAENLYERFGLHNPDMSNGKLLNQLILAARAIDIDLSLEMDLQQECFTTTTSFTIGPNFEFALTYWTADSWDEDLHDYIDDLHGQSHGSVSREIERRELEPLDVVGKRPCYFN